jgi:hypothetical protein
MSNDAGLRHELVVPNSPDIAARHRADLIRSTLVDIADGRDRVLLLIREAKEADDAKSLGYVSWPAYVAAEFKEVLPRLGTEERLTVVQALRQMGMSTRAIAPIVGTSHEQVRQDTAAGVKDLAPATVTGLDGKNYPAPNPSVPKRRRRPLPDQWRDNHRELAKVVERFERQVTDDRFRAHQEALAKQMDGLRGLIDRLKAVHHQVTELGGPQ